MHNPIRKIPFIAIATPLALLLWLAFWIPPHTSAAPPKESAASKTRILLSATATQKGRSLVLLANTNRPVNLSRLSRLPAGKNKHADFLCFRITAGSGRGIRRICLGGGNPLTGAGLVIANARGRMIQMRNVPAVVKRPSPTRLVVTLLPSYAGLTPGSYQWNLVSRLSAPQCKTAEKTGKPCSESTPPASRPGILEIKEVRAVGCTTGATGLVRNGPRNKKLIALTFDDGPSSYTPGFLDVLKSKGVRGTFFVLGQQVAAYPEYARRIVREGHEIASHSWKHDLYPSAADLRQTSATIKAVTGFKPCSFRPPGGAQNSSVVAGAGASGMKTILWDVDPFDWRLPGTGAIANTIIRGSRNGSIVLTHDGGGPRSQTLSALPQIIDALRARGYGFTTVSELLGGKIRYRKVP